MNPQSLDGMDSAARDRLYSQCCQAISAAGPKAESLLLARLALLLMEQVNDEARCTRAIEHALRDLPIPTMSAL